VSEPQRASRRRRSGLATRLYKGEAGINVIGRRRVWFSVAGAVLLIALLSFGLRGFTLGIEFKGGTEFSVPASVGTISQAQDAVSAAGAEVDSAQQVGRGGGATHPGPAEALSSPKANQIKTELADEFDLNPQDVSTSEVSGAWGAQVTRQAFLGLGIFLVLVVIYLIFRFEWRMAVGAVASLILDLVATAGVYSLVGFEVSPSTVIGFLTILGYALYDVVVVFDKVQENTRGITGGSGQTYAEAANLAVNQTLMRSINTGLVALLPVGGMLFIGAGLLGAGTLQDLGLVLFVGMGVAVYSSIFFATPVLVTLKEHEPRFRAHTQRVLARRAAGAQQRAGGREPATVGAKAGKGRTAPAQPTEPVDPELAAVAGSAPKVGSRPTGKRSGGARTGGARSGGSRSGGSRSGGGRGGRPGGAKRR
jgi:preprotein translocase subunit SecF